MQTEKTTEIIRGLTITSNVNRGHVLVPAKTDTVAV
jgi:hypothetical protein